MVTVAILTFLAGIVVGVAMTFLGLLIWLMPAALDKLRDRER